MIRRLIKVPTFRSPKILTYLCLAWILQVDTRLDLRLGSTYLFWPFYTIFVGHKVAKVKPFPPKYFLSVLLNIETKNDKGGPNDLHI